MLWSNTGVVSLATQFLHTSALIGGQFQRTLDDGATNETQSVLASLRRPFGTPLQRRPQRANSKVDAIAAPPSPDATATPFGALTPAWDCKKALHSMLHSNGKKRPYKLAKRSRERSRIRATRSNELPLINLTQRISPVISVTTSIRLQTLRDRLNPAANGHTRVFSIALSAPFTYGNTSMSGRIDPRLPATISGKVLIAGSNATGSGANSNFATFGNSGGGVGNVLVTLDNRYVQRTDVTGSFEFSFVPPGQHQVHDRQFVDPTRVHRKQSGADHHGSRWTGGNGVVLHRHLWRYSWPRVRDRFLGNPMPLSNVQLRVDGGTYAQTDNSGAFGFGGLSAGQHVVTVIPQSIPASADFAPSDLVQKISVSDGRYATFDFRAQLLGSIAGTIVMRRIWANRPESVCINAYVVGEPGELRRH